MSDIEKAKQLENWAEQEGVDTEGLKDLYQSNVEQITALCFAIIDKRFDKIKREYNLHADCSGIDSGWYPDCFEEELIEIVRRERNDYEDSDTLTQTDQQNE